MEKGSNKALKEQFLADPRATRELFRSNTTGKTLYPGNCLLAKPYITRACEVVGLNVPEYISSAKHTLVFTVNGLEVTMSPDIMKIDGIADGDLVAKLKDLASLMYPPRKITEWF